MFVKLRKDEIFKKERIIIPKRKYEIKKPGTPENFQNRIRERKSMKNRILFYC